MMEPPPSRRILATGFPRPVAGVHTCIYVCMVPVASTGTRKRVGERWLREASTSRSRPAGAMNMSAKRTVKSSRKATRGKADFFRMDRMSDEQIMRTSPPELADLPDDFWRTAVLVVPEPKVPISLRVDRDVLQWFREEGPRYQSRMNAVLRSYMEQSRRGVTRRRRK
jgi:uncharacterized protein (DUF4415 family)